MRPDELSDEPITILAVDDLPQNLRLLDAVLSPRGYRVLTAALRRGGAATMLPTSGADLVLLDILMPGMDGYEVCRRIRRTPGLEFLPVVMITASGDQEKVRAIEAGADDFVTKPFEPGRAAGAGGVAGPGEALPGHDPAPDRRARTLERRARGARDSRRSTSSSGSTACAGSCRRSWSTS